MAERRPLSKVRIKQWAARHHEHEYRALVREPSGVHLRQCVGRRGGRIAEAMRILAFPCSQCGADRGTKPICQCRESHFRGQAWARERCAVALVGAHMRAQYRIASPKRSSLPQMGETWYHPPMLFQAH